MILSTSERISEMTSQGWWGDITLSDLFLDRVSESPNSLAIVDPSNLEELTGQKPRRLSWSELADEVHTRVELLKSLGINPDDRVLVQLPNSIELSLTYLACMEIGAIITPVPTQYRHFELAGVARRTSPVASITMPHIGSYESLNMHLQLRDETAGLRIVLAVIGSGEAVSSGTKLGEGRETPSPDKDRHEAAPPKPSANDVVTICWTSGTEAEPKGVPRSHNEWIVMGQTIVAAAELKPGVRLLNPFPMINMAGVATGLVSWLLTGAVLVQHHPFDLGTFLSQIRDEGIEYTVAPPAILNLLLAKPELVEGIDFGKFNRIGSGSAPLSEWMIDEYRTRYGVEIINYFGSNEGIALSATPDDIPKSSDRALYFPRFGDFGHSWKYAMSDRIKTRLVASDTDEEITAEGQTGELRVKGATVFSMYWGDPELTARSFDNEGWYRSGDLFQVAGDGRYYQFIGRLKDIVIRGGVKISAEEIEGHLMGQSAISDVAIVGAPDEQMGERLCAFVVFHDEPVEMRQLNDYLIKDCGVAVYKQIESLRVVTELPRNAVGKVLKRDLRRLIGATQ